MLDIHLERDSGIPLYIQIVAKIKQLIERGKLVPDTKLPTERELSVHLKVSRNTISAAYQALEQEGYLVSYQGRGTYVSKIAIQTGISRKKLEELIEEALNEALELGFTLEDFTEATERLINHHMELRNKLKVVFIECNREQLNFFIEKLDNPGVLNIPVLLEELREDPDSFRRIIDEADLIVTTVFHSDEVRKVISKFKEKDIIEVALTPQIDTIVKIARIPPGTKVGLVCLSNNFIEKVLQRLKKSGIDSLMIKPTTTKNKEELKKILEGIEYVIVSPGRQQEVKEVVEEGVEIIEFIYSIDSGSLNMLKATLTEDIQWDWYNFYE